MTSYIGRVVMIVATGRRGEVIAERWDSGPILEIRLENGKCIWVPDYKIAVL